MTVPLAMAMYFVIWWIVLFAVLPIGMRSQREAGAVVPGTPPSAPERPRFAMIIITTSLIAALILGGGYAAFSFGLIDLRPSAPVA